MKPAFALSLSFEGISLLHRCAGGWRNAGEVALDAPDLAAALAGLRGAASRLDAGPLYTKLIIPNDQIRYLSIETGLAEGAERDAMVRASLEGATPYAVADLAYDISVEGTTTHIAAVARETLAEAEGFALEHDFGPLGFVAIPGSKAFLGEPYFGPSQFALSEFPSDPVEPDGVAVVVIGPAQFPVEGQPAPTAPEVPEPEPTPESSAVAPAASHPGPAGDPVPTFASRRRRDPVPTAPVATLGPDIETAPTTPPAEPPATAEVAVAPEPAAQQHLSPPPLSAPPPMAADRPSTEPAAPALAAPVRARPAVDTPADAKPATRFGGLLSARRKPEIEPDTPPPPIPEPIARPAPPAIETPEIDVSGMPPRLAAAVLKSGESHSAAPDETQKMTVFGARQPAAARARPRYLGLILTAVLLLFLAGVAAWASIFLDDDFARLFTREPARTEAVARLDTTADETPSQPARTTDAERAPESPNAIIGLFEPVGLVAPSVGETRALAAPIGGEDPVKLASLDPSMSGLAITEQSLLDDLRPSRSPVISLKDSEAATNLETRYAVTGIWSQAPGEPETPSVISLDDLYIGSIDNHDLSQDAVALPAPGSFLDDAPINAPASPAAPDTRFDLDERGLVRATPEGALAPDGFLVYLGRPGIVPPPTPDRTVAAPETDTLRDRLAGFRPRPRPGNLSERAERGQLGGLTRNELAGLRPRLRPQSVQQAHQENQDAQALAQTGDQTPGQTPAQTENDVSTATAQAVATASRPRTRPSGFAARVKKQKSNADNAVAIASIAPRTETPKIPSKASVSKQATLKNAINLRNVNLIGVYGTPSNRRALVRLPSGRYKKVQVGDRIDGGQVVAIGDSELRYQKSGRNLVLKIPSG